MWCGPRSLSADSSRKGGDIEQTMKSEHDMIADSPGIRRSAFELERATAKPGCRRTCSRDMQSCSASQASEHPNAETKTCARAAGDLMVEQPRTHLEGQNYSSSQDHALFPFARTWRRQIDLRIAWARVEPFPQLILHVDEGDRKQKCCFMTLASAGSLVPGRVGL